MGVTIMMHYKKTTFTLTSYDGTLDGPEREVLEDLLKHCDKVKTFILM